MAWWFPAGLVLLRVRGQVPRFQSPPVNPCMTFSVTRLTDVLHLAACAMRPYLTVPDSLTRPRRFPDMITCFMP
jgi:hypothetical protein